MAGKYAKELGFVADLLSEIVSSRTSLASRKHFEVHGLGLEAYKCSKMFCPQLEDSTIVWLLKKENNRTKHNISSNLLICFLSLFEKYCSVRAN